MAKYEVTVDGKKYEVEIVRDDGRHAVLKVNDREYEDDLVHPDADRPQPVLDRDAGGGMSVTVGRVRPCPILDVRFVVLGHNTVRGAAGGSIHNAELLMAQGLLG